MFPRYVSRLESRICADVRYEAAQAKSLLEDDPSLRSLRRSRRTISLFASLRVGYVKWLWVACKRIPKRVKRHAFATNWRGRVLTDKEDLGIPPTDIRRQRTKKPTRARFALFAEPLFIMHMRTFIDAVMPDVSGSGNIRERSVRYGRPTSEPIGVTLYTSEKHRRISGRSKRRCWPRARDLLLVRAASAVASSGPDYRFGRFLRATPQIVMLSIVGSRPWCDASYCRS
jgi:hypothetical protein